MQPKVHFYREIRMERETIEKVLKPNASISIQNKSILSKVVYRKNESVEFTGLDIIFLQGCQKVGFGNTAKPYRHPTFSLATRIKDTTQDSAASPASAKKMLFANFFARIFCDEGVCQ